MRAAAIIMATLNEPPGIQARRFRTLGFFCALALAPHELV